MITALLKFITVVPYFRNICIKNSTAILIQHQNSYTCSKHRTKKGKERTLQSVTAIKHPTNLIEINQTKIINHQKSNSDPPH